MLNTNGYRTFQVALGVHSKPASTAVTLSWPCAASMGVNSFLRAAVALRAAKPLPVVHSAYKNVG